MRARVLAGSALLAAALPGAASAGVVPTIARGSCWVELADGTGVCVVQLDPNPAGEFGSGVRTVDGYGVARLDCQLSGSRTISGGYGFEWEPFPHGADVCRLTVQAYAGTAYGYVT